jgi:PAS domain S-box-containing protein
LSDRATDYIHSIEAKCRDCYRCLRVCPVKAIRLEPGDERHELHARVIDQRCILDGLCVLECPQGAKRARRDTERVQAMLREDRPIAVSLAPSFPSAIPGDPMRVPAALRRLGFDYVQETAVGAEMVGRAHARLAAELDRPLLTSSCPAIVNLIQCHYPDALPYLAPLVSPMIAHARYLKSILPEHRVVFIGPCIAKKHEAETDQVAGVVDAALTFEELLEWLAQEGINLEDCAPGAFDGISPHYARLFAVDGGTLRTAALDTDLLSRSTQAVSGLPQCKELVEHLVDRPEDLPRLIEVLSCEGGCISGPTNPSPDDTFRRRQRVLQYAEARAREARAAAEALASAASGSREDSSGIGLHAAPGESLAAARAQLDQIDLSREFVDRTQRLPVPDESTIREILAKAGKHKPEDDLNCGACGYDSCREKAIAVFHGWADPEMCIPYMRERAESMSYTIVSSTPNAIFVVTPDETIIDINPSAERRFRTTHEQAVGRKISEFMSPDIFREVVRTRELLRDEVEFPELDLIARRTVFWEDSQRVVVAILADATEEKRHLNTVQQMRRQTLDKAQGVINKQMEVAQKIAGLLGETTAETKVLLTQLMRIMRDESGERR